MIVAFDLDDTLYRELDYVESGFGAVSQYVEQEFGIDAHNARRQLWQSLASNGRGSQFDELLKRHNLYTASRRDRLLQTYRQHDPQLALPAGSLRALESIRHAGHRLFLVTDGNHIVQAKKVEALGLNTLFEHCYLTNRYGREAQKPSSKVFELMLNRTSEEARNLVYVGDNPRKDFIGVRRLGGTTVRVHTGPFANEDALPEYDGDLHAADVTEAAELILAM
jgi:putative hydrolase of the HAD superfamily